jgi:hypothetical protein
MKLNSNCFYDLRLVLIGLCTVAIVFGFTTGSVLAQDDAKYQEYKKKQAEKELPPHKQPAPASPSGHQHANLAEAATNPLAPLI